MKKTKILILSIVLMIGFVVQCEIFQAELWNFDRAYYKTSSFEIEENKKGDFVKDVIAISKKNKVEVFSTYMDEESNYKMKLNIFGDSDTIKNVLKENNNIEAREYTSLLNGITKVTYYSLTDLCGKQNRNIYYLSYIGNDNDIQNMYEELKLDYCISKPEILESKETDVIVVIWGLIVAFLVVINGMDAIRRKKEVVVRISLGEDIWKIIFKTIVTNILLEILLYFAIRKYVFQFISGEYERKLTFCIFLIGSCISNCVYLSFAFYSVKKVFSNINDSKSVLYMMYGIKIVVTVMAIFTISTNISSLHTKIFEQNEKIIDKYKECTYLNFRDINFDVNKKSIEREEEYSNKWNEIYLYDYDKIKPIICINVLEDRRDYILVNYNARNTLGNLDNSLIEKHKNADFIIFIPKRYDNKYQRNISLENCKGFIATTNNEVKIEFAVYSFNKKLTYIDSNSECGFETTYNPIIIFQNNVKANLNGSAIQNYAGNSIIYDISSDDISYLDDKYGFSLDEYEIVKTNVKQAYEYKKSFITRLISFLSSISVVVFCLQITLIFMINSLEYNINVMELSLKKILGYGIWEKNRKIIICSLGVDFLSTIALSILGFYTNILCWYICMAVGLIVGLVEVVTVIYNIAVIENTRMQKAFKGGYI